MFCVKMVWTLCRPCEDFVWILCESCVNLVWILDENRDPVLVFMLMIWADVRKELCNFEPFRSVKNWLISSLGDHIVLYTLFLCEFVNIWWRFCVSPDREPPYPRHNTNWWAFNEGIGIHSRWLCCGYRFRKGYKEKMIYFMFGICEWKVMM